MPQFKITSSDERNSSTSGGSPDSSLSNEEDIPLFPIEKDEDEDKNKKNNFIATSLPRKSSEKSNNVSINSSLAEKSEPARLLAEQQEPANNVDSNDWKKRLQTYGGLAVSLFTSLTGSFFAFIAIAALIPFPAGIIIASIGAVSQLVMSSFMVYRSIVEIEKINTATHTSTTKHNFAYGMSLFFTASYSISYGGQEFAGALMFANDISRKIPLFGSVAAGAIIGLATLYETGKLAMSRVYEEFVEPSHRLKTWLAITARNLAFWKKKNPNDYQVNISDSLIPNVDPSQNPSSQSVDPRKISFHLNLLAKIGVQKGSKKVPIDIAKLDIIFALNAMELKHQDEKDGSTRRSSARYNDMVDAFVASHVADATQKELIKKKYLKTELTPEQALAVKRKAVFLAMLVSVLTSALTAIALASIPPPGLGVALCVFYLAVAVPTRFNILRASEKEAMEAEISEENKLERPRRSYFAAAYKSIAYGGGLLLTISESAISFKEVGDMIVQAFPKIPVVWELVTSIVVTIGYALESFSYIIGFFRDFFNEKEKPNKIEETDKKTDGTLVKEEQTTASETLVIQPAENNPVVGKPHQADTLKIFEEFGSPNSLNSFGVPNESPIKKWASSDEQDPFSSTSTLQENNLSESEEQQNNKDKQQSIIAPRNHS